MSNRITSISPAMPPAMKTNEDTVLGAISRTTDAAVALFASLFVAILPRLTRAKLVEAMRTITEKVVSTTGRPADVRFTVTMAMNDLALDVAREAHMRGYITQSQVAPSQTGLGAEMDRTTTEDEKIAVFVKQFTLLGDLIEQSTNGSDTGVTPATLAASLRDSVATGVSRGESMGEIVEGAFAHLDRAVAEGYLTEDEIQNATRGFDDDYAGGSKYLAHVADLIETSATRRQGAVVAA